MKLSIKNFKSIGSLVDYEIQPLTILCGTNSSGKSSFIQLILLLKQTIDIDSSKYQIFLKGDLFSARNYNDLLNEKSLRNKLRVSFSFAKKEIKNINSPEISLFESFGDYECIVDITFDFFNDKEIISDFTVTFLLSEGGKKEQYIKFLNTGEKFSIETNTGAFSEKLFFNPDYKIGNISYAGIYPISYEFFLNDNDTLVGEKDIPQIEGIKQIINNFFNNISYIGPLRDQPKDEYIIYGKSKQVGSKGENLAEVLETYSEEPIQYIQFDEDNVLNYKALNHPLITAVKYWICDKFKLCLDIYSVKNADAYAIIVENYSKVITTIKHVGFGLSQILPVIVEGLLLPKSGTLVLEQPEIHLHPKIQSQLFDFLYSLVLLGKNVIVETHSDHFITRLRRRIAEDDTNLLKEKVNLTFVENTNGNVLFRNISLDEYGTAVYPKDFIENPDVELKAIIQAQMKKRLSK